MTGERQTGDADKRARAKRTIVQRMEEALQKAFKPADKYHPEQYYLRGRPGPKAQAKQKHDPDK